jgi:hypothetical protein
MYPPPMMPIPISFILTSSFRKIIATRAKTC